MIIWLLEQFFKIIEIKINFNVTVKFDPVDFVILVKLMRNSYKIDGNILVNKKDN